MLDQTTRQAILRLHDAGNGTRAIARALQISRGAVNAVLRDGRPAPPPISRAEKAEPLRDDILALAEQPLALAGAIPPARRPRDDSGVRRCRSSKYRARRPATPWTAAAEMS